MIADFDAFERLGLDRNLVLDDDQLKEAFHRRSAMDHPDQRSDGDGDFARLVQARGILSSPAQRLQHWLELNLGENAPDRRGSVDSKLMDLFGRLATCISSADEVIAKRENSKSALAKALTENDAGLARESIEELQVRISKELDVLLSQFPKFAEQVSNGDCSEAAVGARNLAFLEKWQSQLKERYARLF